MMRFKFAAILAALVAFNSLASADEPVVVKKGKVLTDQAFVDLFDAMGYEPKKYDDGIPYAKMSVKRGDLTYTVYAELSPSRTKIWFCCALDKIDGPEGAPADKVLNLLAENDKIGPAHFVYRPKSKQFWLYQPLDNVDITSAKIRNELELLMNTVEKTKPVWSTANWNTAVEPGTVR